MWWDDLLGACCWSGIFDALFITPWGWLIIGVLIMGLGIYIAAIEKEVEIGLGLSALGLVVIVLSWRSIRNEQ